MATIVTGQEQDKEQQAQQGAINVSGTPSATVGGGTGQPATATPTGRKASGSGRFTNIQSYIQANTGGGQKLAGQIGQKVGQQTAKLGQAVEGAKAINPQLEAERQRIAQASGFAQQVQQDPTQLLDKTQQFRQLATGQTGLQPIQQQAQQAFDTAQGQLGQVQQLANMTGSEAGRFELLRQSLGRPSYTRGQQRLDQLLIQSGGGGVLSDLQKQTMQQARAGEQLLGSTRGDIEAQLSGLGTEAQKAQQLLTGALGTWDDPTTPEDESAGALGSLQKDLTTRSAAEQSRLQDMYDRARAGLQSGEVDRDVAEMLGLTGIVTSRPGAGPTGDLSASGQNILLGDLSSEDLLSRLQRGFTTVTPTGVANEADYNRLQALKQLAGQTGPTPIELDKEKLGQAGVAANLNAEQLQKDIQARLGALQQQYEGTSVDPLAAEKLMAGLASRSMGQLINLSDDDLLTQFNPQVLANFKNDPVFRQQEAAKIRKDLQTRQANLAYRETAQDRATQGMNLGLNYGQLTTGDQMSNALSNYLNALYRDPLSATGKTLSAALIPRLTSEGLREQLGQGFGTEMQRRLQEQYENLGLNRTLKIK